MIAVPQSPKITPDEYLRYEESSEVRHEYINGEIYAMAGGTDAHNTIAGNTFVILRSHLRGTGCRVFISDMKVNLEQRNIYYYPDVVVTCDERDRQNLKFKQHPCLIIEVLSDSTEAFDRGDKFADYRTLASLQEYVLISQARRRLDCYRRDGLGSKQWYLKSYEMGESLILQTVGWEGALEEIYEDVESGG